MKQVIGGAMGRKAPRKLIETVTTGISDLLCDRGFMKRRKGWFTFDLSPHYLGVVTIPRNVEQGDRMLGIVPMVGVCCEEHSAIYRELTAGLTTGYETPRYAPTISTTLSSLVPTMGYGFWRFYEEMNEMQKSELEIADCVIKYGIPYMRQHSDLNTICDKFMKSEGFTVLRRSTHLPIALALLGRHNEAKKMLKKEVRREKSEFRGKENYMKRFSQRLLKRFEIEVTDPL
jgi:hypothetical protein